MLDIYRGASINLSLHIDDNTRLIRQLLGEDIIRSSFNYHKILDIAIGDYIIFDDVKYYINNLPNIKKNSSNSFDYDLVFESEYYELLKTQFLDLDGNSDFSLVGNLETFIDLIITNMNRISSGWARGTCDQTNTDYKLLNFSKYNCMQVLQTLCEEFEGEFFFDFEMYFEGGGNLPYHPADEAVISYKPAAEAEHYYKSAETTIAYYSKKDICFTDKAGSDSGLTFLYHSGLRNIQRTTLSDKNIVTRLYAFGSGRNLASDYRDHSTRLKFVNGGLSFLEKNISKYGIIEHTEIFDDIYPHWDGVIDTVNGITKFTDGDMFNLNNYLLPGVTAKLHFNSGNLGGYEFEVSNYNHTTHEFTIIAFTDEIGYVMPNATLKPAIGDKYVLIDIKMPQTYIDIAETALLTKAQTYLDDNCEPRVTYILEPDWRYFKVHLISLEVGDFITIQDTDLGIDVMTRIVELTKSIANEYKYTLKITDHLEVQLIQRMYSEQEDLKAKIEIGEGGDIIRSRRNWRTSEELRSMIFDTDGYFDMGKIRPESVETSMLSVGAKSTQFILSGVEIEGNYTSDVSKFHASEGSLIHLSIADEIRTWTLSENTQTALVDLTAYYIYAKCTIDPGYTGQIVVDSTQRKFDDDPTYYYFLIGVLHSVVDSVRGISLTYGQTIINGKFIRTGKIESTDGLTYFDLDNGIIQGKVQFIANTSGYANISDKPDLSVYDGKAKVFRQTTAPISGMQAGDIWIDTDDGDKPRTYNGAIWILMYTIINGGNIVTGSITADKLDINNLAAINADLGSITAGNFTLNTSGFIKTIGKNSYANTVAGFWLGYDIDKYKLNLGNATNYLKWDGVNLSIKGTVEIIGGLDYGSITGTKPPANADNTGTNNSAGLTTFDTRNDNQPPSFYYAKGSGIYVEFKFRTVIGAPGSATFGSLKTSVPWGDVSGGVIVQQFYEGANSYKRYSVSGSTWGSWTTVYDGADHTADIVSAMAYEANVELAKLGSTIISGGYLRTDLIKVKKVYVGGGTNEDIYFEDSGIRLYDAGSNCMRFYKSGLSNFGFTLFPSQLGLSTDAPNLMFGISGRVFNFYSTGQLQLPNLSSNPTSNLANGQICSVNGVLKYYNGTAWKTVTVT